MLNKSTLQFLKKLKSNNNKLWMDEHRADYESGKNDFIIFVNDILKRLSMIDNSLSSINAKDCIFRINRDIRFSKNKNPYKINFAAYFSKGGRKGPNAGYYLHAEPGNTFLAAGIWMPEPEILAGIRQEIDYNFKEFESILKTKKFKQIFSDGLDTSATLSRPPKGYEIDNPAIEYVKLKSFIIRKSLHENELTTNGAEKQIVKIFEVAKPLVDFLNRSMD